MDYKGLTSPPMRTRSSTDVCQCFLCTRGRQTLVPQAPNPHETAAPLKMCPLCNGQLAPGVSHVCTRSSRNENILELVRSVSTRSKGQILSQTLKDIRTEAGSDHLTLPTKGRPLPVTVGCQPKQQIKIFTQEHSKALQNVRHFSDNDMRAIEQVTRKVFGRKAVATGSRETRVALNHELDDLFKGKYLNLKLKPRKKSEEGKENYVDEHPELDNDGCIDIVRPVVVCADPEELIYKVIHDHHMDPSNTEIKIGADDGQGIFKICVQILSKENGEPSKTKFKEGGVHKLLILLAVPDIQELYSNLKILLQELRLEAMDFSVTSDLKIVLLLLGKDSGSCRHACIYCEDGAPWSNPSKLNTLGSLQAWHEMWVADGSRASRSKDFQNMRSPPLLKGSPSDLILEIVAPPELHLELGIPDKIVREMVCSVFQDVATGKEFMMRFYKKENITVCGKQGGKLEGNATRKLLKVMDSLELELGKVSAEVYMKGLPFTRALRNFDRVVHSCFGQKLLEGWEEHIAEFSTSYKDLISSTGRQVTITPKVHILTTHVEQFLQMKNDGRGLGYWSEQAFESVHADFKQDWENVKVDINHPDFLSKMMKCIIRYNSRHI